MDNFTAQIDWYNPINKEKARLIGEKMELELEEMRKVATIAELGAVYRYHRKNLSILEGQLTKLFNKDTDEWLKNKVVAYQNKYKRKGIW